MAARVACRARFCQTPASSRLRSPSRVNRNRLDDGQQRKLLCSAARACSNLSRPSQLHNKQAAPPKRTPTAAGQPRVAPGTDRPPAMGAAHSHAAAIGAPQLERLAGADAIPHTSPFWDQLFSLPTPLAALDPEEVETALAPHCRQLRECPGRAAGRDARARRGAAAARSCPAAFAQRVADRHPACRCSPTGVGSAGRWFAASCSSCAAGTGARGSCQRLLTPAASADQGAPRHCAY